MRLIDADAFKMEDFRHCLDCDSIIQVIKYAPTIEAEPVKHGRWVCIGCDEFVCSECCAHYEYESIKCEYNYCPNCGAKMDATDINVGNKDGGAE